MKNFICELFWGQKKKTYVGKYNRVTKSCSKPQEGNVTLAITTTKKKNVSMINSLMKIRIT